MISVLCFVKNAAASSRPAATSCRSLASSAHTPRSMKNSARESTRARSKNAPVRL